VEGSSVVEIAVFALPGSCANTRSGCDWTDLGISGKLADITSRCCCSNDATDQGGLCGGNEEDYGRLIINTDKFDGNHRFVEILQSVVSARRFGTEVLKNTQLVNTSCSSPIAIPETDEKVP
jgi:hypothetical protein